MSEKSELQNYLILQGLFTVLTILKKHELKYPENNLNIEIIDKWFKSYVDYLNEVEL